ERLARESLVGDGREDPVHARARSRRADPREETERAVGSAGLLQRRENEDDPLRSIPVVDERARPELPAVLLEEDAQAPVQADETDPRRANEHRVERCLAESLHVEVRLERIELTPERVPLDSHVHETRERVRVAGHLFRDEDRARARAPHGHAFGDAILELVDDPVLARELADRRALATRDAQRLDLVELLQPASIHAFDAEAIERGEMFREVALKTEDAGARGQRAAVTNRGLQVVLAPGSTRAKVPAWPRRVRATPRQRAWH